MDETAIKPSEGHDYYSADNLFWNNYVEVIKRQARAVSGREDRGWIGHLIDTFGTVDRALFISCGNGWVERECFTHGLIREAYGFDIMPEHIAAAELGASEINMPAHYQLADGNNLDLDWPAFDLIVNNGAVHHIAFLDRLMRQMRAMLAPGGHYIIADYTGAHRNQYGWKQWEAALKVNASLPARYQKKMRYAHMPTMLAFDPTEAIHSELQMAVTRRYFDIVQEARYGGGIGYELLSANRTLYEEQDTPEGREAISMILAADQALLSEDPSSNLFTFAICRPKEALPPQSILDQWSAEETEREAYAVENGGRYYPPTPLEMIYNELADAEYQLSALKPS